MQNKRKRNDLLFSLPRRCKVYRTRLIQKSRTRPGTNKTSYYDRMATHKNTHIMAAQTAICNQLNDSMLHMRLQKAVFHIAKDGLPQRQRRPFAMPKATYGKTHMRTQQNNTMKTLPPTVLRLIVKISKKTEFLQCSVVKLNNKYYLCKG